MCKDFTIFVFFPTHIRTKEALDPYKPYRSRFPGTRGHWVDKNFRKKQRGREKRTWQNRKSKFAIFLEKVPTALFLLLRSNSRGSKTKKTSDRYIFK